MLTYVSARSPKPYAKMRCACAGLSLLILLTWLGFDAWRGKLADRDASLKILSENRQAGHNYFLMDRFEAGIVLTGTEVKAARDGKIQLKDAYAAVLSGEAWLLNAHISPYSHGNRENQPPVRNRKLLLHRREIDKLLGATREKGLAVIPTKVYLKHGQHQVRSGSSQRQEAARQARSGADAYGGGGGAGGDAAPGIGNCSIPFNAEPRRT